MEKTGEQLAIDGAERAADHADRVHDDWQDQAMRLFKTVADRGREFMTEDVVKFAEENSDLPQPPDPRAWGMIARKAKDAGDVRSVRVQKAKKASSHSGFATVWIRA